MRAPTQVKRRGPPPGQGCAATCRHHGPPLTGPTAGGYQGSRARGTREAGRSPARSRHCSRGEGACSAVTTAARARWEGGGLHGRAPCPGSQETSPRAWPRMGRGRDGFVASEGDARKQWDTAPHGGARSRSPRPHVRWPGPIRASRPPCAWRSRWSSSPAPRRPPTSPPPPPWWSRSASPGSSRTWPSSRPRPPAWRCAATAGWGSSPPSPSAGRAAPACACCSTASPSTPPPAVASTSPRSRSTGWTGWRWCAAPRGPTTAPGRSAER
jgi:hypothetical protein